MGVTDESGDLAPGVVTVLLVDETQEAVDRTATALERADERLTVTTATTVTGALDALEQGPVDCLVAGHTPPGFDGLELLSTVRNRDDCLPVVLFPVEGSEALASEAISAGVTEYCRRAAGHDELADRVIAAVDGTGSDPGASGGLEQLLDDHSELAVHVERVLDGVPLVVAAIDAEGTFRFSRGRGLFDIGTEPGAVDGQSVFDVYADHPAIRQHCRRAIDGERLHTTVDVNGRTFESWYEPVSAEEMGHSVLIIAIDITERKHHQDTLETLNRVATGIQGEQTVEGVCERTVQTAQRLLDFNMCSIMLQESEWLVPYANSAGAPPDGSRRMRTDHGIAGKTYQSGETFVLETLGDDTDADPAKDDYRSAISIPVGDHGVFQAVETVPNAFDSSDVVLAELLVTHAATAIDRIEREESLQRRNEQLEEFVSFVSHDLRNPLNVAAGHLELAREEAASDHLDTVAVAHDRIEELIDDLLTLAREGNRIETVGSVALDSLVEVCWENVETSCATLQVDTDEVIEADRSRLRQLLANLLRNAVQHAGDDVTVSVGTLEDGFYLEDDGPGIPESKREAVFEAGVSAEVDGTGFGLRIVEQVADAHDWDITVTDGTEGGARFEITGVSFRS